jgi:SAM-dependent methyltransferase
VSLNLKIRHVVPSISRLTYVPPVKFLLNLLDIVPRLVFREFRRLPPNHLRCRVGVSNRLFANQALHLTRGVSGWMYWFAMGWCDLDSDIIELGVGCGREAVHLRDLGHHGDRYRGSYLGVDIDAEALAWCRSNFDKRFEFAHSTHESTSYPNDDSNAGNYRFPRDDQSVDFVIGLSLLTHLLEHTARNYLEEGARVLKPGGKMVLTCFAIDFAPRKLGDRQSFKHRIGNAYVESLAQPEAAVAYESTFLCDLARESGFSDAQIMHAERDVHHALICTR